MTRCRRPMAFAPGADRVGVHAPVSDADGPPSARVKFVLNGVSDFGGFVPPRQRRFKIAFGPSSKRSEMMDAEADGARATELHPKRTTSFGQRLKRGGAAPPTDLAARILRERERTKYWARVLLLFPLVPVALALSTVTVGGVIINAAASKCNADLLTFMQGAVVLSYVLLWFYAYCWMGPKPIRSLRTVRVFYLIYGLLCCIWWGGYGTLQATTATASGFESCLSMSPSLYLFSQYQIAVFWIFLIIAVGFFVKENTDAIRERKLAEWRNSKSAKQKAEELAKDEAREKALLEAKDEAQRVEDEQRRKIAKERNQLYGDDDEELPEDGDGSKHSGPLDNDNHQEVNEEDDEGDEEEDVIFEQPSDNM